MKETSALARPRRTDRASTSHVTMPVIMPTATGDAVSPLEHVAYGPTHDEIACRAHQLYQERGCEPGRDVEDWFQAERELRTSSSVQDVADRIRASKGPYAAA